MGKKHWNEPWNGGTEIRPGIPRLRGLTESLPVAAMVADPLGSPLVVNDRFRDLLGNPPDEGWLALVEPGERAAAESVWLLAGIARATREVELGLIGVAGPFRATCRIAPIEEDGRVLGWAITLAGAGSDLSAPLAEAVAARDEGEERQRALEERLAEAELRGRELEGAVAAGEARRHELQEMVEAAELRARRLEGLLTDSEAARQEVENRLDAAEAQRRDLEERLADTEAQRREVEARLADSEVQRHELVELLADGDARATEAESRLALAEDRLREAERVAAEAESRLEEAATPLSEAEERREVAEQALAQMRADLEGALVDRDGARAELESLLAERDEVRALAEDRAQALDEAEARLAEALARLEPPPSSDIDLQATGPEPFGAGEASDAAIHGPRPEEESWATAATAEEAAEPAALAQDEHDEDRAARHLLFVAAEQARAASVEEQEFVGVVSLAKDPPAEGVERAMAAETAIGDDGEEAEEVPSATATAAMAPAWQPWAEIRHEAEADLPSAMEGVAPTEEKLASAADFEATTPAEPLSDEKPDDAAPAADATRAEEPEPSTVDEEATAETHVASDAMEDGYRESSAAPATSDENPAPGAEPELAAGDGSDVPPAAEAPASEPAPGAEQGPEAPAGILEPDDGPELDQLAARLRSGLLRSALGRWRSGRGHAEVPPFHLWDEASTEAGQVVIEMDEAGVPVRLRVVRTLEETPLLRALSAPPGGEGHGWRRCAASGRPAHDYAEVGLGPEGGHSLERLLLPFATQGAQVDRLVLLLVTEEVGVTEPLDAPAF